MGRFGPVFSQYEIEVGTMTLTEAYEEIIRLHQQIGALPCLNEYRKERYETDRCILTANSDRSVLQQFLSECLNAGTA